MRSICIKCKKLEWDTLFLKYGQNLERGDMSYKKMVIGISVQSDIETLIALCDMDKPLVDTGEDIVYHHIIKMKD